MKLGAGLAGIVMFIAVLPVGAGERMTLKVSPAVAFAPASFIVRAFVEADADNRAIPSGTYPVKAMLIGTGSEPRATLHQQVNAIANGSSR